jgi:hypothetical protein
MVLKWLCKAVQGCVTSTNIGYTVPIPSVLQDPLMRLNASEATSMLFNPTIPLERRCEAFFVDWSFIPLFVQQGYPKCLLPHARNRQKVSPNVLDAMSAAADACCDMDWISERIGKTQNYKLLPTAGALACRIGHIASGSPGWVGFPEVR